MTTTSWFDGLGDKLRETANAVGDRLDRMDDELDRFARRAIGDDDDANDGENANDDANDGDASAFIGQSMDDDHDADAYSYEERRKEEDTSAAREFTADEVDALRQALSIAKEELAARDARLKDAEEDSRKLREAAMRAAKELAAQRRKEKAAREDEGVKEEEDASNAASREDVAEIRARLEEVEAERARVETEMRAALEESQSQLARVREERAGIEVAETKARAELERVGNEAVKEAESLRAEIDKMRERERQTANTQSGGGGGGRGKKGKKGGRGGGSSQSDDASRLDALTKDLEEAKKESEKWRKSSEEAQAKLEKVTKDHTAALERARAEAEEEAQRSSAADETERIAVAESRATDAEKRLRELEEQVASSSSSNEELRKELEHARARADSAESQVAQLQDELTDAVAAREDMEGAVTRGAVSAASANSKMAAAEKAKTRAEAELAEIREQLKLMDATSREAATSIAAREKAELAQQKAEAKRALAEKEAEEAKSRAEKFEREGEERKRRFSHVQTQFQATEAGLRETLEEFERELKALRGNASEAEKMKAEAISIVEETQAEAAETKAALDALTVKAEKLERALEASEASASEARTRLGVLEEMEALRKNQPKPEAVAEAVQKTTISTQTDALREPQPVVVPRDDEALKERVVRILSRLDVPAREAVESRKSSDGAGFGMLMGMFMGDDDDDSAEESSVRVKPNDGDLSSLLDRLEKWASAYDPSMTRAPVATKDDSKDAQIDALTKELAELKADVGERSSASLAAVNRRAQEAETAAAEALAKLAPLEKANRELSWQISMLAEQDEKKIRPVLPQSGWFQRAVTGCTAPRRPKSVLLNAEQR